MLQDKRQLLRATASLMWPTNQTQIKTLKRLSRAFNRPMLPRDRFQGDVLPLTLRKTLVFGCIAGSPLLMFRNAYGLTV